MTAKRKNIEETEFEGEDKISDFEGPFDPNNIDVDIAVVNLGSLLEMLEYGEIDLSPDFQRSGDLWTMKQKSRLIESILLGLPIPSFYFSEDPNTHKLVVVDGLQRLCAFKEFWVDKTLKLKGMQFLSNLNKKTVDDLDRTQIRRIKSLKITLNTLRKETPANVKYVLFQRINTAGIPLKQQEMRNALYQGKATDLLKRMAKCESFIQATGESISTKRMADYNFANRFIAFYLNRETFTGENDAFLGNALDQVNKMETQEIDDIYNAFDSSMSVCYQIFGDKAFRRPDRKKQGEFLKINKPIFDVLSVSIAHLSTKQQEILIQQKMLFKELLYTIFLNETFIKSFTQNAYNVNLRFSTINELINYVLNYDN